MGELASMVLNDDYADLLRAALDHSVDFLVVGATALAIHGMPRFTGDLDIFVRPTEENARLLLNALSASGFPIPFALEDLIKPDNVCFIGNFPCRIDFLTGISGVSFEEAWEGRVHAEAGGLVLPVIGLEALLRNKLASGRLKDLADAELIKKRLDEKA
jgi:hypothetical protein